MANSPTQKVGTEVLDSIAKVVHKTPMLSLNKCPLSDRERRKISKKTEGIFRNIGSVMDNIIDIFH